MNTNITAPTFPDVAFDTVPRCVLVTGATGFVGQLLVRALLKDGHDVIALTRDVARAASQFDGKVRPIASMNDLSPDQRVDIVINLAGARILGHRWTDARKQALRQSRVALTDKVVDWIGRATHKPMLMLSASAIGYYGIQAIGDDAKLNETAPPQPMFMSDLCREWEEAAAGAVRHGVRVECMRFGLVLGHEGALPMMLLPIRMGIGGRLGSGRQWLSWIHVDDLIAGIAHRWKHALGDRSSPAVGATNFTAPISVSQLEFSKAAARVWGRPCVIPTPGWPMRLAREGFAFRYSDIETALRSLK